MSTREHVEDELAAMLAAAGVPVTREGPRVGVTAGNLEIGVTLGDGEVEVMLAGWRQRFAIGDDEDGLDAAALALDLVGAGLFGQVRVVVERFAGAARRFTLQLAEAGKWREVSVQGSRPWNPLARAVSEIHASGSSAPPRYRANAVTPLPWAPWAGRAGFFGAAASGQSAELPVDGELDLHNFHPREVKRLVLAYLEECAARGITGVRIVHGKGIGNLRRTVHAILARHPRVASFRLGGHGAGSWGATLVELKPGSADDKS